MVREPGVEALPGEVGALGTALVVLLRVEPQRFDEVGTGCP